MATTSPGPRPHGFKLKVQVPSAAILTMIFALWIGTAYADPYLSLPLAFAFLYAGDLL
jgi:hypothetical protein